MEKIPTTAIENIDFYIAPRYEDDWTLLGNRHVEILDQGKVIDRGLVDVTTLDGQFLWLAQDGVCSRRMIENLPGRRALLVGPTS